MFGDFLQPTHLLFILVVALIFLGPKRLPEVARSLGKGLKDFRGALSGDDAEGHSDFEPQPPAESDLPPVTPATTAVSHDQAKAAEEPFPGPSLTPIPEVDSPQPALPAEQASAHEAVKAAEPEPAAKASDPEPAAKASETSPPQH